ncbi:MAG: PQQ-binding-like beta-propeller repeat protein [Acidobacteriota bacterium]
MHPKRVALICIASLASAGVAVAESEVTNSSSPALHRAGWPTWSGPHGDLTSGGHGVFDAGVFGLERAWSQPLGSAYSGIVVAEERLLTMFSDGESDHLVALDPATGAEHWRYRISKTYKGHDGSDDGPLSTPTVAGGAVYGLGAWGGLFAVSLDDGQELWRRDLVADFGGVKPHYGFTTTPVAVDDLLVVQVGGTDGRAVVAFDRKTGESRWTAGDDRVAYQSPLTLDVGGETLVVAITNRNLLGLAPATGEVLFKHPHTEGDRGAFGLTQPVPVGEGAILLTDDPAAALFQVSRGAQGYAVEEVWRSRSLRGGVAVPVPYGGYIYGYSGNFLTCIDAATGETQWKSRPPGQGDLILVDGHLVILARSGEVVVVEATPEAYREVERVQALDRGYYSRPSFADGRVFVRNLTDIGAIGVTARTEAAGEAERAGVDWDLRGDFGVFVEKLAASEDKRAMVDGFLAEHPTLPVLEGKLVHFVFRGDVADLAVSGNFIRDESEEVMHRVDGTDFYFRSYELPEKAVFTYQFSVFDEKMTDPSNPRKVAGSDGELSVLATRGWREPSHLREPEGPRGSLETLAWKSEQLDNEREVQVYLPPGYGEGDARYPLLLVNDGNEAVARGQLDRSLDNLIGTRIAPMIVAFVPISWRETGGSGTGRFTRAQVEELIPLIDRTYRTDPRRESRGVMGQSLAHDTGFAAMYLALHHPEAVSKVAAQSYRNGQLEDDLLAAVGGEKHDLDIVIHWSSFERAGTSFDGLADAKNLVAALEKGGYRPEVIETHDGPGWGMWQGRMAEVLAALFPLR